jgi:hypothetical protein
VFMCTSLSLSIVAMRNAGGSTTILEKKTPAKQSVPGANPPAKGPAPMTATPSVDGTKGQPQPLRPPPKK